MAEQPSISISLSRKINLGNYESADFFVSLNGVTADTLPDEMEELLNVGKIAYDLIRKDIAGKVAAIRGKQNGKAEDNPGEGGGTY